MQDVRGGYRAGHARREYESRQTRVRHLRQGRLREVRLTGLRRRLQVTWPSFTRNPFSCFHVRRFVRRTYVR